MKVLIIESEPEMVKHISFCLKMRYSDLQVIDANDSTDGIHLIETESPDLVFLASSSPVTDSVSVIGEIREFSDVGLILVTESESTDLERAEYLEAGADDCINKQFSPMEVLGRVKALMRRINGSSFNKERTFILDGDLIINFGTREVFASGKKVKLTPTEYKLLTELVRNAGRVLTHQLLLEKVWSPEYVNDVTLVKKYIYRLRHKIETNPDDPRLLLSERGIGYRFAKQV
jgi:two-component system KDP operon response regulator KdpE